MMARAARAVSLALLAAVALPAVAQARSANIVDAHVGLRLAADASLLVSEQLSFRYDGTFEGSYRDIVLRHGERIADVRVSQDGRPYAPGGDTTLGSHDRPGVFGVTSIPGGARIVWHYRATNERRTYTISYRVIDGAVAYDDVIDVGWAVWGSEWKFDLPHLQAELVDKALDPGNQAYRVWGHPRGVRGRTDRGPGLATLVASNVPQGTAVELRVTVPRRPGRDVSGARHGAGNGLPKILAEEKGLDASYNSAFNRAKRWVAHHTTPLALAFAAVFLLTMLVMRLLAREHRVSTPKYLSGPPDDAGPALAYGLAHEGGDSNDTVLATLLDLVERGFYETKQATTGKEKLDLAIAKSAKRPDPEKLEHYEKRVLDFFDQLLGEDSVALSAMRDRIPEHDPGWASLWTSMTLALDSADEGQLAWDRSYVGWQVLLGFGVLGAFAALIWAYADVERGFLALPAAAGLVTLLVVLFAGGKKLKRLAPGYRERNSQWMAFQRWTEDFPRLDDDPPATLDLWKRILIYGVAFGTADRMIASGRIPAPVMASADSGSWTYYAFAMPGLWFNGSEFSSGFASQVAPESSGGGGGFSGGGGGFSGGGGGGSW